MYIFVHKMYSKHCVQNTASPKACGFSRLDYDDMNPTKKNRVKQTLRHKSSNRQKQKQSVAGTCLPAGRRGAPQRSFTPPVISREKDAYTAVLTRSSWPFICNPCTILGIATLGSLVVIFLSALQCRPVSLG
jgi:hypothetical protein